MTLDEIKILARQHDAGVTVQANGAVVVQRGLPPGTVIDGVPLARRTVKQVYLGMHDHANQLTPDDVLHAIARLPARTAPPAVSIGLPWNHLHQRDLARGAALLALAVTRQGEQGIVALTDQMQALTLLAFLRQVAPTLTLRDLTLDLAPQDAPPVRRIAGKPRKVVVPQE